MMYGGYGWGWMMLMPLVWIVLIAAIAWAVVQLAHTPGGRSNHDRQESPQEILDRRLASGEIDADAYRRIRDELAGRESRSP